MAGHCEIFDHTADVGLAGSGDSLGELLEVMAETMCDLICPRCGVAGDTERSIRVEAPDVEALTVDFLEAVLDVLQTRRLAVESVKVTSASETSAQAELRVTELDPRRHEILTEIKAVTYHELKVVRTGERWTGRVILDL